MNKQATVQPQYGTTLVKNKSQLKNEILKLLLKFNFI